MEEHELKFILRDLEGNSNHARWENFEKYGIFLSNVEELIDMMNVEADLTREIDQKYISNRNKDGIIMQYFPSEIPARFDTIRYRTENSFMNGEQRLLTIKGRGMDTRPEVERYFKENEIDSSFQGLVLSNVVSSLKKTRFSIRNPKEDENTWKELDIDVFNGNKHQGLNRVITAELEFHNDETMQLYKSNLKSHLGLLSEDPQYLNVKLAELNKG